MKDEPKLEQILNDCLERIAQTGETVEQCLARYPEQAVALEPLLRTAAAIKKISQVQPRSEFRARARYQFREAVHEAASRRQRFSFSFRFPQWAITVSVVAGISLAGGGVVAAANQSLPDSPLYAVKLATEEMRLNLTTSPGGKAGLYAQLADWRVSEIAAMADAGNSDGVFRATEQLNSDLAGVAGQLTQLRNTFQAVAGDNQGLTTTEATSATGGGFFSSSTVAAGAAETTMAAPTLTKAATSTTTNSLMTPSLSIAAAPSPVTTTPSVTESQVITTSEDSTVRASSTVETPNEISTTVNDSRRDMQTVLLEQQTRNLELLYTRLAQAADPDIRTALLQAIAVSQAGYERALESLGQP
jgi:hypothetical protein